MYFQGCAQDAASGIQPCILSGPLLAACRLPLPQERLERRKVHEQLQVLRGNIRVCCRVRPSLRCAGAAVMLLVQLFAAAPALACCVAWGMCLMATLNTCCVLKCRLSSCWCSPGAGGGAGSGKEAACGVSYPYSGSLCIHANERRQQEFEFDAVFNGEASQVGSQLSMCQHQQVAGVAFHRYWARSLEWWASEARPFIQSCSTVAFCRARCCRRRCLTKCGPSSAPAPTDTTSASWPMARRAAARHTP